MGELTGDDVVKKTKAKAELTYWQYIQNNHIDVIQLLFLIKEESNNVVALVTNFGVPRKGGNRYSDCASRQPWTM